MVNQPASRQLKLFAEFGLLISITAAAFDFIAVAASVATADCEGGGCLPRANMALPLALAVAGVLISAVAGFMAIRQRGAARTIAAAGLIIGLASLFGAIMLGR